MADSPGPTREQLTALVRATAAGLPRGPAADAAGVGRADFRRWLARGRRGDGPPACVRLAERVAAATARTPAERLARIRAAERAGFWQAGAWELERRYPRLFGDPRRELAALRRQVDGLAAGVDQAVSLAAVRHAADTAGTDLGEHDDDR